MPVHRMKVAPVANRRCSIGGSNDRIIMGNDVVVLLRLWQERQREVEPDNLIGNLVVQFGAQGLSPLRYERITHRAPAGWYILALSYTTAVILLGWWPWSILLILLLFSSSKRLRPQSTWSCR